MRNLCFKFQVDGEFTLNENICDIDGMNTAASAFEELYESAATMVPTGDLVYLPNNPYTPQQLFFINTAQVFFFAFLGSSESIII